MKKYLLPGMLAALAFAACTNEEIVSQQTEAPEADLSDRPVIGQVDLTFGAQTRIALDEKADYYGAIEWGLNDKMGARIIDQPTGDPKYKDHSLNYTASNYASSNYKYTRGTGATWTTEALMVEGNYMFYAPYNENARGREALQVEFPIEQEIRTDVEVAPLKGGVNVDAIRQFYANDGKYVVAIGHKFLSAKEEKTSYEVNYNNLYAFPKFTLKNSYKVDENGDYDPDGEAKEISINKVVIGSAANIRQYYKVNHGHIISAYEDAKVEDVVAGRNDGYTNNTTVRANGSWRMDDAATYLLNAKTANILDNATVTGEKNGKIVVTFNPALKIAAGGGYSFNVVMPAAQYSDLNLQVVYESEGKNWEWNSAAFVETVAKYTYAPGNQYPTEEYNNLEVGKTPVLKDTKGILATYELKGDVVEVEPEPVDIVNNKDFIDFLKTIKDNSITVSEGPDFKFASPHEVIIDADLMAAVNEYLKNGKVVFRSAMKAEGDLTITNKYTFEGLTVKSGNVTLDGVTVGGKLTQDAGTITLKGSTSATSAEFKGTSILTKATINGAASFKAATITDAAISGAVTFNSGDVTIAKLTDATSATINGGKVTVNGTAAMGDIALKAGELVVNVENYIDGSNAITVGTLKNGNTEKDKEGTLTLNKTATLTKVILNAGTVKVNANVDGVGDSFFSANWKFGELYIGTAGIIQGEEFTNKGTLTNYGESIAPIKNPAGSILCNYATITVSENEGEIIAGAGSSTYVTAGSATGSIDNTNKTALFLEPGVKNIVSYTFNTIPTTEQIEALKTENYSINKVIFNAGVNFDKNFTLGADVFHGVDYIDLKGTVALAEGALIPVNVKEMKIIGNTTVDGFSRTLSGLGLTDAAETKISVVKNATLTIKEAAFGSVETNILTFDFEAPAATDPEGTKAGALKLQNAYVGVGSTGIVPTTNITVDSYSKIEKKYWDGSAWQ